VEGAAAKRWLRRPGPWVALTAALANVVILTTDAFLLRYAAALLLLCLLPGLALMEALFARSRKPELAVRAVLGVGASCALTGVSTLLLHYLPGPLALTPALIVYDLLILVPLLVSIPLWRPTRAAPKLPSQALLSLALLLILAAAFRLAFLGYSEFQGDEGRIMMRATEALAGQDDALFKHHKGPVEALTPMAIWLLTGRVNEWAVRLPFALVNLAGLAGLYFLGRRLFGERVAIISGALLGINGFFVGFGRIVQYQSFVFGMGTLSLLCLYHFEKEDADAYQLLGALFLGYGALAHYDIVAIAPAVLYVYGRKFLPRPAGLRKHLPWMLISGLIFIAIAAAFYLPYSRDPFFAETVEYLGGKRVGGGLLHNNLSDFFLTSTIYNSTYYVAFLGLVLVGLTVRLLSALPPHPLLTPALFFIGAVAVLAFPDRWQVGEVNLAVAPFALTLVGMYVSRRATGALRLALTWFTGPFLIYIFVVAYPLTHVYNLFPGWALLCGVVLDGVWGFLWDRRQTALRVGGVLLAVMLFFIFAYYAYFVFVGHSPEYKRTYSANRNPFYWTVYDDLPPFGYFGFPYRAGWKVVGQLYDDGTLNGEYGSNEEEEITGWYTRNARRSYCPHPRHYFIAVNVQDEVPVLWDEIEQDYGVISVVQVGGETKLTIYERFAEVATPAVYHVEDYVAPFDRGTRVGNFFREVTFAGYSPLRANLDNKTLLLGYDLDTRRAVPGGELELKLYWQCLSEMDISFHIFVHLETDRIWGQGDSMPNCGHHPTTAWRPGEQVADPYVVTIDPSTPPGEYPLLVGMYELDTWRRLPVVNGARAVVGDSVHVATVAIPELLSEP
jgi:4-amino-4-deoxy-L-arabinose transferase-like glycosyltransferase